MHKIPRVYTCAQKSGIFLYLAVLRQNFAVGRSLEVFLEAIFGENIVCTDRLSSSGLHKRVGAMMTDLGVYATEESARVVDECAEARH